ncbi:MAG: DUF4852 domain-containing protein [Alphaproteobacteria bacterium]
MLKNKLNILNLLLVAGVSLLFSFAWPSYANVEDYIVGYEDKFLSSDDGPGAKVIGEFGDAVSNVNVYETPTNQALSLLYWAVGLYKFEDDKAVDLFASINECAIYKEYYTDEFEWSKIRVATRKYLENNSADFPTRFEFAIPIKLKEYDLRKEMFSLAEGYEIISVRRFEVYSTDYKDKLCIITQRFSETYPRVVVLEFSRPFTLTGIPMKPDVANDYVKRRYAMALKAYNVSDSPPMSMVYKYRDAILNLKVKIFTNGKLLGTNSRDLQAVQMLGILEGFDVYEDTTKENLMFSQNYITTKDRNKLYMGLQEQYEILKEKSKGAGVLH